MRTELLVLPFWPVSLAISTHSIVCIRVYIFEYIRVYAFGGQLRNSRQEVATDQKNEPGCSLATGYTVSRYVLVLATGFHPL